MVFCNRFDECVVELGFERNHFKTLLLVLFVTKSTLILNFWPIEKNNLKVKL